MINRYAHKTLGNKHYVEATDHLDNKTVIEIGEKAVRGLHMLEVEINTRKRKILEGEYIAGSPVDVSEIANG